MEKCRKCENEATSCGWCRDCRKEYDQQRYKANLEKRKRQIKANKERVRKQLEPILTQIKARGCKYCIEVDPCCMDFHHRIGEKKDFAIGDVKSLGYSLKRIINEIQKCDVVCANCHRKLHRRV